jgi:nitroreductase
LAITDRSIENNLKEKIYLCLSFALRIKPMNELYEIIRQRRSIRKFLPQTVEPEKTEQLLKSVLMAPTSKNSKSWAFVVVDEAELLQKLSLSRPMGSALIANAPMAIVVLGDPSKSDAWLEDASIASAFLQLQAQALGLGSCWVQITRRPHNDVVTAEQYVRTLLSIPEEIRVLNVIAVGYKDEERRPYDEARLPYEKIHRNRF